ncbi:sugar transferase [Nocardioides montaniterrae]
MLTHTLAPVHEAAPRHLHGLPAVHVRREPMLRRTAEVAVAALLLIAVSPIMIALAAMVYFTSDGPVFFKHTRIGYGGRAFQVIKFRTMHRDAEVRAAELFARLNTGSGPLNKIRHDPRITGVGRWMRRLSLDELPQLFNVLNGTMSLIGPRPSSPQEVARFAPSEHRRHAVRPGMTGLAQVSGRSDLEWSKQVELDVYYAQNQSPILDLYILARTPIAVLAARGAY